MSRERKGKIVIVSSPQDSKDSKLKNTDLLADSKFAAVVREFDSSLKLSPKESLNEKYQWASVVMSVGGHRAFLDRLNDQMGVGYLGPNTGRYKTAFMGHSIGETAAMIESGVLDIATASMIMAERARITEHPYSSALRFMVVVVGVQTDRFHIPGELLKKLFGGKLEAEVANKNTPNQIVVSLRADNEIGETLDVITKKLDSLWLPFVHPDSMKAIRTKLLPVPNAFHSSFLSLEERILMQRIGPKLTDETIFDPQTELYSPILNGVIYNKDQAKYVLLHQLTLPVNFTDQVAKVTEDSAVVMFVTADVLGTTPGLIKGNLRGKRDIPILNVKDMGSLETLPKEAAMILRDYSKRIFPVGK